MKKPKASRRRARAAWFPLALPLACLALPAQAQQAQPDFQGQDQPMSRVEITGSNIRRAQAETASPVLTLTRADIDRAGKTTVAELLQTLAVDNQGSVPTTFGNGFATGASGISLRGLGAASTLVLLNGRRIAPYGLADDGQKVFSDLNIIPADAIERIEILKDGASAIYGSDAIAGVVNVILRQDFVGTTVSGSVGESRYQDGHDTRVAITHGAGDLESDRYNALFSVEFGRKGQILDAWRADRDQIGRGDLRAYGFSAQEGLGGTGAITSNNAAGSAINGNVRNPGTLDYYSRGNPAGAGFTRAFPGAACSNFTSHPQGDPGGACLIDAEQQYDQIQPSQDTYNFFGRGTWQVWPQLQAYGEVNLFRSETQSQTTPSAVSSSEGSPAGAVSNAAVALGAANPDNPYFGSAARLRYLAADVGPRRSEVNSTFLRLVAGVKGTVMDWDIDSALLYSQDRLNNTRKGYLQRNVVFAMLDPTPANVAAAMSSPADAALPPGTYWRIAENAGLNAPAVYAALSPDASNDAMTRLAQADFKASREFGHLPGGPIGLALGVEVRHESTVLDPSPGTETGNIIGLGYSAYRGARDSRAAYGELALPVMKTVELSAALRGDHFSDVGNSNTPKAGFKWTPWNQLALRGTFARGFRAPSAAENGKGGLAAFSTAIDPVRCALGVAIACNPASVAIITSPNPALQPERSKSFTGGVVWSPLPRSSVAVDYWQIKRSNEINQEQSDAAIAAGHIVRDPSTSTGPGDPGAIVAVLANYVNSAQTKVRGVDLDLRHTQNLGNYGALTLDVKWTHLIEWLRTEQDGSERDFAGTHGNCDVTNCMGTPKNRINTGLSWERDKWRVAAVVNFRDSMQNVLFRNDPAGCASTYADGTPAPAGCKIAWFATVDLTARWQLTPKTELYASIQNLFDKVAPLDPLTYGAVSYNPLDYSGAVGRFFNAGFHYKF